MKYIPLLALAVFQVVLGIILLYKRHDKVSRVFMYLTTMLFVWTGINVTLDVMTHISDRRITPSELALINGLNTSGFVTASVILLLLYQSVLAALSISSTRNSRRVILVGIVVAACCSLQAVSGYYTYDDATLHYHYGVASLLLVPYFVGLVWTGVRLTEQRLRVDRTPILRRQSLTFLAALFLSAAWALVFIIIIPVITRKDTSIYVGYYAPFIFTVLMYYGIIWLGLFNFRQIIARSFGYFLSLIGLGTIFIVSVNLVVGLALHTKLSTPEIISLTLISFFVGISFQPVKRFFDRYTNKVFYRDAYDPRLLYDKLNKLLVSSLDLTYVMDGSAKIIRENIKTEFCIILIDSSRDVERCFGSLPTSNLRPTIAQLDEAVRGMDQQIVLLEYVDDMKFPNLRKLMSNFDIGGLVVLSQKVAETKDFQRTGYIVLGSKNSGNPYGDDDARTLEVVANELALAAQNVIRFEEIEKFNTTLQDKVDEATRKLRATNDKLKKLDETKDEFISMASHQLRTPLTSIKGYLSMVLEGDAGKLNPQQALMLKQSYMSSQRMVNLIADLLNLSRLNTGKFVIQNSPTDLRVVVDQEVSLLGEAAAAKDISLNFSMPKTFTILPLDENKIHQVVMNFIDNALYYTPHGGAVDVSLIETPAAVEFRVKDTGIGVPRAMQRHLFTKFYRAENAKQIRPDGTGLGLFMAKKVIVEQGGSIIFESVEGQGSTFGFRFSKRLLHSQIDTGQKTVPSSESKVGGPIGKR